MCWSTFGITSSCNCRVPCNSQDLLDVKVTILSTFIQVHLESFVLLVLFEFFDRVGLKVTKESP